MTDRERIIMLISEQPDDVLLEIEEFILEADSFYDWLTAPMETPPVRTFKCRLVIGKEVKRD